MNARNQAHFEHLVERARAAVHRYGLAGMQAEVVFVLDTSMSMYPMYQSRLVQELATELLALSVHFDDDGQIPAWAFGDQPRYLGALTTDDFVGFVDRQVIRTGADYQGSCRYAPVIEAICRHFFPDESALPTRVVKKGLFGKQRLYPKLQAPRRHPIFVVFVTAGDCEDPEETAEAIRRASCLPLFWQFAGVNPPGGRTRFRFLERLDRLKGRHVDNCGFFEPRQLGNPDTLFAGLLNEFPQYLRVPEVGAMLHQMGMDHRPAPALPESRPEPQATFQRSTQELLLPDDFEDQLRRAG